MSLIESKPEVMPEADANSLMAVISRVAGDPTIDVEKLERLMGLYERVLFRNARTAYSAALAEMQPELPVIPERGGIKDRAGRVQSTFAKWPDINDAIRPVLAKHGFALSFRTGRDDGAVTVTGILSHREGHSEETTMVLPIDGSGSKNAVQAVGSSTAYGKRYAAAALLNLTSRATEDHDDDGQNTEERISEAQQIYIQDLAEEVKASTSKFLAYLKIDHLEDLPARRFDEAVQALQRKQGQRR